MRRESTLEPYDSVPQRAATFSPAQLAERRASTYSPGQAKERRASVRPSVEMSERRSWSYTLSPAQIAERRASAFTPQAAATRKILSVAPFASAPRQYSTTKEQAFPRRYSTITPAGTTTRAERRASRAVEPMMQASAYTSYMSTPDSVSARRGSVLCSQPANFVEPTKEEEDSDAPVS